MAANARTPMARLIAELKQTYASAGLDCGNGLLPPVKSTELNLLSKQLGLPLPSELREVYAVHGGQQYIGPGITGLFGQHRLHTPAEVVEHHQIYCDHCLRDPLPEFPPRPNEWGYWVPQLIPFASWDAWDLCIDSESGGVWEFIPKSGLIRYRPSIAAVLQEILIAVRS